MASVQSQFRPTVLPSSSTFNMSHISGPISPSFTGFHGNELRVRPGSYAGLHARASELMGPPVAPRGQSLSIAAEHAFSISTTMLNSDAATLDNEEKSPGSESSRKDFFGPFHRSVSSISGKQTPAPMSAFTSESFAHCVDQPLLNSHFANPFSSESDANKPLGNFVAAQAGSGDKRAYMRRISSNNSFFMRNMKQRLSSVTSLLKRRDSAQLDDYGHVSFSNDASDDGGEDREDLDSVKELPTDAEADEEAPWPLRNSNRSSGRNSDRCSSLWKVSQLSDNEWQSSAATLDGKFSEMDILQSPRTEISAMRSTLMDQQPHQSPEYTQRTQHCQKAARRQGGYYSGKFEMYQAIQAQDGFEGRQSRRSSRMDPRASISQRSHFPTTHLEVLENAVNAAFELGGFDSEVIASRFRTPFKVQPDDPSQMGKGTLMLSARELDMITDLLKAAGEQRTLRGCFDPVEGDISGPAPVAVVQ